MVCKACGKAVPQGSRFCPYCGAKLEPDVETGKTLIGQTIAGKYAIEARLGSGAMGNIYKGVHLDLGKPVVIKVLHPHLIADETQVKRFKREAKAASLLNHPNVVMIHDFGYTSSGLAYIVMEYIEGDDLRKILFSEGRLAPLRVIRISEQVLSALAEAHAAGIIHRDIKPENIMLTHTITGEEIVKVLDFGIAKLQDMTVAGAEGFKTATGTIFGTPEYMSPEQITGKKLDPRSDLYSFGITMYEMLTGVLPFEGEGLLDIARQHLKESPPSIRERVPECPPELEAFVMKLLEKRPEARWSSAVEAREKLLEIERQIQGQNLSSDRNNRSEEKEKETSENEEEDGGATVVIQDPNFIAEIQKKMEEAEIKKRKAMFEVADTREEKKQPSKQFIWIWIGIGILALAGIGGLLWYFLG